MMSVQHDKGSAEKEGVTPMAGTTINLDDDYVIMTSSIGNISALLTVCAGNSPVTGEFPAQ